jgi:hypothetical protein
MTQLDTHERIAGTEEVEGSSDRSFGLVFAGFFALVAVLPLLSGKPPRWWAVGVALAFLAVTLTRPTLLHPLNRLWTRLGLLLGKMMTPIVVGIIFYAVITPIGWLRRMTGGESALKLRFEPDKTSYWIERTPPGPAPDSIKHQF